MATPVSRTRRRLLAGLSMLLLGLPLWGSAPAETIDRALLGEPGHKVVYQLNKADAEYIDAILFSAGEMLRKYEDDIRIVITVIGPGLHLLGKNPERPISKMARQRAESLAMYGIEFHACGNTMKSLGWNKEDLLDFATVVEIGADDIMLLQEQGFAYLSW